MKIKAKKKQKIEVGVKDCNTCEHNIRCAECVYSNEELSVDKALQILTGYCNKHTVCDKCRLLDKETGYCVFKKGVLPCDFQEYLGVGAEND